MIINKNLSGLDAKTRTGSWKLLESFFDLLIGKMPKSSGSRRNFGTFKNSANKLLHFLLYNKYSENSGKNHLTQSTLQ